MWLRSTLNVSYYSNADDTYKNREFSIMNKNSPVTDVRIMTT